MFNEIIFASVIALSSANDDKVVGHILPFPEEMLEAPIYLENDCSNMHISEWRGNINDKSKTFIKLICNQFYKNIVKYINNTKLAKDNEFTTTKIKLSLGISIIPSISADGGFDYRNLNDYKYRFSARKPVCKDDKDNEAECKEGQRPVPIYGYMSYTNNWLFINNNVLLSDRYSDDFKYYFAHELFHAFSHACGFQNLEDSIYDDEIYAEEFGEMITKLENK